jgi:6-phosphogluconolactonase (cycloisomerase 2 family)
MTIAKIIQLSKSMTSVEKYDRSGAIKKRDRPKQIFFSSVLAVLLAFSNWRCSGSGAGWAPSNLPDPVITGISRTICGLSGGCTQIITGQNLYPESVVKMGDFVCLNPVFNAARTQINCTIGEGDTGIFNVTVTNIAGQVGTAATQFIYQAYLYAAVQSSPGTIVGYTQNPQTGVLTTIPGSPFTSGGNGSYGITVSPDNRYLYTTNASSGNITGFAINPISGALTTLGTYAASSNVNGVSIDPEQRFLFASNYGNPASISVYTIAEAGTLTFVSTYLASAGSGAENLNGIAVNNAGTYLFGSAMGATPGTAVRSGVVVFSINQTSGALTQVGTGPFVFGSKNSLDGLAVSNDDRFLYAGAMDATDGAIVVYTINANGTLTGQQSASIGVFSNNSGAAVELDPLNKHLYTGAFGTGPKVLAYFAIDSATGLITLQSPTSAQDFSGYTTTGGPNDVFLDFYGAYVYTCNSSATTSVSQFSRNKTTGALTKLTPPDVAVTGSPGIMTMTR